MHQEFPHVWQQAYVLFLEGSFSVVLNHPKFLNKRYKVKCIRNVIFNFIMDLKLLSLLQLLR